MPSTNIRDRFDTWLADPTTSPTPTLRDAFYEGFIQAFEFVSGQTREVHCPDHPQVKMRRNLNNILVCAVPECEYGPQRQ